MLYFLLGILIGFVIYFMMKKQKKPVDTSILNKQVARTNKSIEKISIDSFKALIAKDIKSIVIIDSRTPVEFKRGHIKKAQNINVATPQIFRVRISKLLKEKTYIIYAQTEERSMKAAKIMQEKGFNRIYYLEGGLLAWQMEDNLVVK